MLSCACVRLEQNKSTHDGAFLSASLKSLTLRSRRALAAGFAGSSGFGRCLRGAGRNRANLSSSMSATYERFLTPIFVMLIAALLLSVDDLLVVDGVETTCAESSLDALHEEVIEAAPHPLGALSRSASLTLRHQ